MKLLRGDYDLVIDDLAGVLELPATMGRKCRRRVAFGDVRGRLGSVFYTINSRIQKNPPNPIWPLTGAPPLCK